LLELLDPKLVRFQFQMSTIRDGFVAADYFTKHPGRFFSMHLQDVDMNAPVPPPSGPGTGRASRTGGTRRRPADAADRAGQHRLDQDIPGCEDRRRPELLYRDERRADARERAVFATTDRVKGSGSGARRSGFLAL
jgi:hypothetical protein